MLASSDPSPYRDQDEPSSVARGKRFLVRLEAAGRDGDLRRSRFQPPRRPARRRSGRRRNSWWWFVEAHLRTSSRTRAEIRVGRGIRLLRQGH